MTRPTPAAILLVAGVLASAGAAQVAFGAPDPGFSVEGLTVDPDPTVSFLELDSHGDLGIFRQIFFGDGRVQFDDFLNARDLTPAERWSAQLSEAELRALVTDLVESGLFEFDPEVVRERDRQAGKVRPTVEDGGWVEVRTSLLRRASGGSGSAQVVKHHFSLAADLSMSMTKWGFADYPELLAYLRILSLSNDVRRRAQLIPKPRPTFSFAFPQDQRPVLVLTSTGVGVPVVTSMSLYESGRAVVRSRGRSLEVQLPVDNLDRVLRDVDEGGLASFDERGLARERDRLAAGVAAQVDAAETWHTFTSSFRLVGPSGPDSAGKELTKEIVVVGPSSLARRFPSIPAYKALADLEELLFETESFALSSRPGR